MRNIEVRCGWVRRLLLVAGGTLMCALVYAGPPFDRIGDVDLRFGLDGPAASTPWKWAGVVLLAGWILLVERRTLESVLIRRPSSRDMELALYAFGAVMAWSWLAGQLWPQRDNPGVDEVTALGVVGVVMLIVTAAVTEEIVYRGYLAERWGEVVGWRLVGALISLGLFVLPHLDFFGPSWLVHQLPGAIALAVVAYWRRNLPAAMALHACMKAPILIPTVASG